MTPYHTSGNLVIMAPNWLGDAVMALPAVADVRRALPAARLTVAARTPVASLFRLVPGVDEVITVGSHWRHAGRELAGRGFDTAILLPNSFHSALVASKGGVPERWGYRADFRGRLLTRSVPRPSRVHQAEYYRRLVAALGFPNGDSEPGIEVPADARAAARDLMTRAGWDGRAPLVAIAPGAAYGGAKRWPPESFAELAVDLASDGVAIVMVGSAADAPAATAVARAFQARLTDRGPEKIALHNLVGSTDLATLAGVFSHCRALVTNDSGAMHLAAAVGTPVTALFGPTDEHATRPLGGSHAVIAGHAWCRPCMLRECPIDHRCMRSITAAAVGAAARRSL